ncbi:hypothetical protein GQ44DRAFT_700366 [Phaeosphaeriaceae sp. PMI808]|nr:hypothetical protein GQ44DRAFT_700366 [Phaeosphaeriaceae sp. PMI808]
MTEKCCVICGSDEAQGEVLVKAPCGKHWVCPDDVSTYFERATKNESLFPPKCCDQMFILDEYDEHVPFDIAWAYQVKEQGEYATLKKFRVYCATPACGKFLHPSNHITDEHTQVTRAVCEDEKCGKTTCTGCKELLEGDVRNHTCKKNECEEKFQQIVDEKGYQTCKICGATVELSEACNHITCSCGHSFCYVCGKDWTGPHACPHYGQPIYDAEGYNQDGFHRVTYLNREGLARGQLIRQAEDDSDDEGDDDDWEVLQHLTPEQRTVVNGLGNTERTDVLDQLRIDLFEQQGIMFEGVRPARHPDDEDDERDDGDSNDQDDNEEEGSDDTGDDQNDNESNDKASNDGIRGTLPADLGAANNPSQNNETNPRAVRGIPEEEMRIMVARENEAITQSRREETARVQVEIQSMIAAQRQASTENQTVNDSAASLTEPQDDNIPLSFIRESRYSAVTESTHASSATDNSGGFSIFKELIIPDDVGEGRVLRKRRDDRWGTSGAELADDDDEEL